MLPLECCDAAALVRDLMGRKSIRVSVPESLTGFLRMSHVDWSREVEIPPREWFAETAPDFDQLVQGMADLKGRFRGLQTLVYLGRGRIFYTMLGGTRYAARVDWSVPAEAVAAVAAFSPSGSHRSNRPAAGVSSSTETGLRPAPGSGLKLSSPGHGPGASKRP